MCAYCHNLLGNNPSKRKQLKEIRDSWYEIVEGNKKERHYIYEKNKVVHEAKTDNNPMIIIYYVVYESKNFRDAANAIIELTREAQKKDKNKKRSLYLDIDGHRLEKGAFDQDMGTPI